jgi:RNA polymerase sigma-70 factor (ECF subfamily)
MQIEPIWKIWFAKHGAKLLLFARQQARNPADAEDLVQEAFVRIWRLYGHTGEVPPTLVFRTIRRLAIDWVRREDRREHREQKVVMDEATGSPWFERYVEKRERQAIAEDAVRRLPSDQQEVVLLKIWGDLTFYEIGKTLDISINTAASRYRYALEKLRAWVPELLSDERPDQ